MLFMKKAKENYEFEATKVIARDLVEYDENRQLLRVAENYKKPAKVKPFSIENIDDCEITYNGKTISKKNLGSAAFYTTLFGAAGLLLASSREDEYISNLAIVFKLKDSDRPIVKVPMTMGKVKKDSLVGKTLLQNAERICSMIKNF